MVTSAVQQIVSIYCDEMNAGNVESAAILRTNLIRKIYFESTIPEELEALPEILLKELKDLKRRMTGDKEAEIKAYRERDVMQDKEFSKILSLLLAKHVRLGLINSNVSPLSIYWYERAITNKKTLHKYSESALLHWILGSEKVSDFIMNWSIININVPETKDLFTEVINTHSTEYLEKLEDLVESFYDKLSEEEPPYTQVMVKNLLLAIIVADMYYERFDMAKYFTVKLLGMVERNRDDIYWTVKFLEKELFSEEYLRYKDL